MITERFRDRCSVVSSSVHTARLRPHDPKDLDGIVQQLRCETALNGDQLLTVKKTETAEGTPSETERILPPEALPPNTVTVLSDPREMRSFEDIIGLDRQRELLKPILYRALYPDLINSKPEHALLVGYYGTGKSMLAEAMAREVLEHHNGRGRKVRFAHVHLANIFIKWLGESNQNMNRLLDFLERIAPIIVFMDEIDAAMNDPAQTQAHEETLRSQSTFQARLSGLSPLKGVVIIGATNRPDMISGAFLRGGRFGRGIHVPMPSEDSLARMLLKKAERLQVPFETSEAHVRSTLRKHAFGQHCPIDQAFTGADIEQLVTIMDERYLVGTVERKPMSSISPTIFDECYDALLDARQIRQAVTANRLAQFVWQGSTDAARSTSKSATPEHQQLQ